MKFSRLLISGCMLTGLLMFPRQLPAQSEKVMIQELQRDVAQLQNNLRQYKEAQDQKSSELETLLKQSLDANAKLAASLGNLQQGVSSSMAEQQGKLAQPVNALGIKVDQMSQSFSALQTSMDALTLRLSKNDEKLAEIERSVYATPSVRTGRHCIEPWCLHRGRFGRRGLPERLSRFYERAEPARHG